MPETVYNFEAILLKHPEFDASYVNFPFNVIECFGLKGQVKVKAVFNQSITYRGSLVRMKSSCHILGITKDIRNQLGITYGDKLSIQISQDKEPRLVEVPNDIQEILKSNPKHAEFFNRLSYTHRKEYIRWIESAKKEETRQKRLSELINQLQHKSEPGNK